jgi:hypothetical protein
MLNENSDTSRFDPANCSCSLRMSAKPKPWTRKNRFESAFLQQRGSQQTHRWREMDSNPRSLSENVKS